MPQFNVIGQGAQGIIMHPAINAKLRQPNKYITKLGPYDILKHEKYIYDTLPNEFDKVIYNKTCFLEVNTQTNLCAKYPQFKSDFNGALTIKFHKGETIANLFTNIKSKQGIYSIILLLTILYDKLYTLNNIYFMFHGDISAHNIIIDINRKSVKLIDFGLGRVFTNKQESSRSSRTNDLNNLLYIINRIIRKKINSNTKLFTSTQDINQYINGLKNNLK